LPVRKPNASGLQVSTPIPYRCAVGSTARSMPRARIEYGGCSVRNRIRPRRSLTTWASTISSAGNEEQPKARIFPARTRSVRTLRVSSMSVAGSGRWIWYRSIQSVCSRRSDASTSRMIQRRELPPWLGASSIGKCTLVARTTSSRRSFSALPTIVSDSPAEYMSAVSTKLTPASSAAWMIWTQSSWSGLPTWPNIIVPRQWALTWIPVPPRVR
jgi:hypothetical protein